MQKLPSKLEQQSNVGADEMNVYLQRAIAQELYHDESLILQLKLIRITRRRLPKLVRWSEIQSPLISDSLVSCCYFQFQTLFPLTHMVFTSAVSSKYTKIENRILK